MQGRRTTFAPGWPKGDALPGDYCRVPPDVDPRGENIWYAMAPNGHSGALLPNIHNVIEHEDGTISVSPSIVMPLGWHGFLERGIWRSV